MIAPDDLQLLRECLAWADKQEGDEHWRRAFEDMLKHGRSLSASQQSYIRGVHERLGLGVHYANEWSAGTIPRGTSLATPVPEVLLKPLPKRPPGRY